MTADQPLPMRFGAAGPLRGEARVPGDKSISHRSLMFSALAVGESRIAGLLEGEDVLATAAAMRALGATIERQADGSWLVAGTGVGALLQPGQALDMGNSGTSTRLLMGLVATHPISAVFTGDASLSRRPMNRVIEPLSLFGAQFAPSPGGRLPLRVEGIAPAIPTRYTLPVASAQVKSAVLLAGLNTPGITTVVEPVPTRDHTERMLAGFGAELTVETDAGGVRTISVRGEAELRPQNVGVPGDPSSAAFPIVAALLVPGSDVLVPNMLMNPTRTGLIRLLRLMGGRIEEVATREVGGETVADLRVRHSALTAVPELPAGIVPSMVDEFPVFFVAAALADGRTVARGLDELRVKESDRIKAMVAGLQAIGVAAEELEDGIAIEGSMGAPLPGGGTIATHLDHRIAMSLAVAGLVSRKPVTIDDMRPVATSFPGFVDLFTRLGAPPA